MELLGLVSWLALGYGMIWVGGRRALKPQISDIFRGGRAVDRFRKGRLQGGTRWRTWLS